MKKFTLLLTVVAVFALAGNVSAQSFSLSFPSGTTKSDSCYKYDDVGFTVSINNLLSSPVVLKWRRIMTQSVTGFTRQVCDPVNCFNGNTSNATFNMNASATGAFIIHFYPNGNVGEEVMQMLVFDPSDSSNTLQTLTFHAKSKEAAAGVSNVQLLTAEIYPNPVSDVVNINLPANSPLTNAVVYNIFGQQVKTTQMGVGTTSVDLSGLPAGQYVLHLQNKNNVTGFSRIISKQ